MLPTIDGRPGHIFNKSDILFYFPANNPMISIRGRNLESISEGDEMENDF